VDGAGHGTTGYNRAAREGRRGGGVHMMIVAGVQHLGVDSTAGNAALLTAASKAAAASKAVAAVAIGT